jgi:hypothetical protein
VPVFKRKLSFIVGAPSLMAVERKGQMAVERKGQISDLPKLFKKPKIN